jgi:hypothetical protein
MREVLEWGLAGYMSNPEASDEDVAKLLEGGFPRGLATRAVVFLPLAYGRRILRDVVSLPDTFLGETGEVPLASEPLFTAATALAAEAGREEVGRVGMHSSEVDAVNKALHAGSKAADLVVGPPWLRFDGSVDGARGTTEILAETLAVHGSKLPCQARMFPRKLDAKTAWGQLDIVVSAPALGERRLTESFVGQGNTIAEARANALGKFQSASLHVLLASLEDERLGGNQVEWETWSPFRACLGPLLRQWSTPPPIDFGAFLDGIKRRLLGARLSPEVHWHRMFVAVGPDGVTGHESLLDNEDWQPGIEAIAAWPWPRADKPYALRQFTVLLPMP